MTLKVMLSEAVNTNILEKNPSKGISKLKEDVAERKILTMEEFNILFDESTIGKIWNNNLLYYTACLLSATTGLRLGEVQALRIRSIDFNKKAIIIDRAWTRNYGLKEPKNRKTRIVPILYDRTETYLRKIISLNDHRGQDDFLFYNLDRKQPVYFKTITKQFYSALRKIGISEKERDERHLTFHSLRHFFITRAREILPDYILQNIVGHHSIEMTNLYTSYNEYNFDEVRKNIEKFI